jgi:hypothetical protein
MIPHIVATSKSHVNSNEKVSGGQFEGRVETARQRSTAEPVSLVAISTDPKSGSTLSSSIATIRGRERGFVWLPTETTDEPSLKMAHRI